VSTTGALTEVAGSPFTAAGTPSALGASPDGKYLFVCDGVGDTLQNFAINPDGSLTARGAAASTGGSPYDVNVSPNSNFVYTANYSSGTLSGFAIGSDGSLTELTGSPYGDASGAMISFAIVPDQGPTAAFNSDITYVSTANFSGAASSDPDGSIANYNWDFGDGSTPINSPTPQISHTFNRGGTFTVTLLVTDDENCSDVQIGTGQTLACNGTTLARTSQLVTIPPLSLKFPSGKQIKSTKSKGKTVLRVQVQSFLNRNASITYQFQKSKKNGACKKKTTVKKHKSSFKNFGRSNTSPGINGRNLKVSSTMGGKKIVPGRYRVKLRAKDAAGEQTNTITSASFCVK
jgi:DNA-binding beta-propeller fold protein YncE